MPSVYECSIIVDLVYRRFVSMVSASAMACVCLFCRLRLDDYGNVSRYVPFYPISKHPRDNIDKALWIESEEVAAFLFKYRLGRFFCNNLT